MTRMTNSRIVLVITPRNISMSETKMWLKTTTIPSHDRCSSWITYDISSRVWHGQMQWSVKSIIFKRILFLSSWCLRKCSTVDWLGIPWSISSLDVYKIGQWKSRLSSPEMFIANIRTDIFHFGNDPWRCEEYGCCARCSYSYSFEYDENVSSVII
jgi:hypothetical protein